MVPLVLSLAAINVLLKDILEGFNRDNQWRTWGRGSPGQRPPARGLGATLHSVLEEDGMGGARRP